MILMQNNEVMNFFEYIFYRSYVALSGTKFKDNSEPRSLALVSFVQISILGSLSLVVLKLMNFYNRVDIGRTESQNIKYLVALPLVFIFWNLNERYFRRQSLNDYELLKQKFRNNKWNRIIPIWLILLFPFILFFSIYFILSVTT
jgi:hypothetical protein